MSEEKNVTNMLVYKILTQLIIILGWIRRRLDLDHTILSDRTIRLINPRELGFFYECCDCGLRHKVWTDGRDIYFRPVRPQDYDYYFRWLAGKATLGDIE